jgi:PAS domain S-box-containing protein
LPVEQIVGRTHAEILPPRLAQLAVEHIRSVRESGQPCTSFEEIEPIGGQHARRILEWRRFLLRLDQDEHVLVAGMANDVTERTRLESDLPDR